MSSFISGITNLFRRVIKMTGADFEQVSAIVHIKLRMDNRRPGIIRRRNETNRDNSFVWSLAMYAFLGLFMALVIFALPSFILAMMVFFSYVIVMISMSLVTDFSSVLLDTSDNTIILPRPVTSRTLFVARLAHIFIYLAQITGALVIFPSIAVAFKFGFATLAVFCLSLIFAVLTAIFFTNALYLLILRFADEEKLRNIINYFQIIMTVTMMGAYQLLPRIMRGLDVTDYAYTAEWWHYLAPPVWLAVAVDSFQAMIIDLPRIQFIAMALTIPSIGTWFVSRYLSPVFSKKIGALATPANRATGRRKRRSWTSFASLFGTSSEERATIGFVDRIISRDRTLKLKVYPSYGYVVIFAVVFIFRGEGDFAEAWRNLPSTNYHLLLLYMAFMVPYVALAELPFSDDFRAAWVYHASPISRPGIILSGMLKAVAVRWFLPVFLLLSLFVIVVWGPWVIGDVIVALLNNLLLMMVFVTINRKSLPLSREPKLRATGNFAQSLLVLILLVAIGFGHGAISGFRYLPYLAVPIQLTLIYAHLVSYRKTRWTGITL